MAVLVIFILTPVAGIIFAWRMGVKSPTLVFATAFAGQLIATAAYMAWGQHRLARMVAVPRTGDYFVFIAGPRTLYQRVTGVVMLALYAAFVTAVAYGVRALVSRRR